MYFYYHYRFASTDEKWYQSPTQHLSQPLFPHRYTGVCTHTHTYTHTLTNPTHPTPPSGEEDISPSTRLPCFRPCSSFFILHTRRSQSSQNFSPVLNSSCRFPFYGGAKLMCVLPPLNQRGFTHACHPCVFGHFPTAS
jgi:hypothetical protein